MGKPFFRSPEISDSQIGNDDKVWNPVTGCTKISEGCDHCWAFHHAKISRGAFGYPIDDPMAITYHKNRLTDPVSWTQSQKVVVSAMGDFFHGDVLSVWQDEAFDVMVRHPRHTFIICTKRPMNMVTYFREKLAGLPIHRVHHIWFGVSAENQKRMHQRLHVLMQLPDYIVRFVVLEPLLEKVYLGPWAKDLAWVVAGPETGMRRRPYHIDWFRSLKDECVKAQVPFFLKHLFTARGRKTRTPLFENEGHSWKQYPKMDRAFEVTYRVSKTYRKVIMAERAAEAKKAKFDPTTAKLLKETVTVSTAMLEGQKAPRFPKWTEEEDDMLRELCKKNWAYIEKDDLPKPWGDISLKLNEKFGHNRTAKGVRKRWENMTN